MEQYTKESGRFTRNQETPSSDGDSPVKEKDGRFSKVESGLGKSVREGSGVSWGVVIMLVVGAYALFNLVRMVLRFFS